MRRCLEKSLFALLPIFNDIACGVPLSRRLLYLFCIDLHCAWTGAFIAIGHIQNHNAAQMKTVAQFILALPMSVCVCDCVCVCVLWLVPCACCQFWRLCQICSICIRDDERNYLPKASRQAHVSTQNPTLSMANSY